MKPPTSVLLFIIIPLAAFFLSLQRDEEYNLMPFNSPFIVFLFVLTVILFLHFCKSPEERLFRKKLQKNKKFWEKHPQKLKRKIKYFHKKISFINRERKKTHHDGLLSEDINDYIIENDDFTRSNDYDSRYMNYNRYVLFYLYNSTCPLCMTNPCEHIDHFFIPKSKGGNFIMKRKNGELVNNAVPLCSQCNIKKSNLSYTLFIKPRQLYCISKNNAIMTALIRHRF